MSNDLDVNTSQLLSALRGGSALVVAYVHAFQVFCLLYFGLYGFPHLVSSWMACYAVIVFFIVSGFMIALSVQRHTGSHRFDAAAFFRARVLRIYPPLIAAIMLSIFIYFVMLGFGMHGIDTFRLGGELFVSREKVELEWNRLLPTLLLIYTIVPGAPPPISIDGPLWTLVYEWWFYLVAMFAATAFTNRGKIVRFVPMVAVLILFVISPAGTLLWVLWLIWLAGYALGTLHMRGFLRSQRMPAISLGVVATSIAAIVTIGRERTLTLVAEPLQRYGDAAHWTMLFIALIMTTIIASLIRSGVTTRVFNRVASYSYTLYLIHYPLLLFAFGLLHPWLHVYNWVLSFVVACVAATLVLPIAAALASVAENRALLRQRTGAFWKWMTGKTQTSAAATAVAVSQPLSDRGAPPAA